MPDLIIAIADTALKTYPSDARSDGAVYPHSPPVHNSTWVKSLGQSGYSLGTCIGLEIRVSPDGKQIRQSRAAISNGLEGVTQINLGDEWSWQEWHSLADDAKVRKALDDLDAARAMVAKGESKPAKAEKPADSKTASAPV